MAHNPRCLYENSFEGFSTDLEMSILGCLCDSYHGDVHTTTREAWAAEVAIMKNTLSGLKDREGRIIFEYDIPRIGKRIDVVLLFEGIIFCIEFKVGERYILEADVDQVFDYALDLKNFHKYSQDKVIVPILVATKFKGHSSVVQVSAYNDKVVNPLVTGRNNLAALITSVVTKYPFESPVNQNWIISPYAPTPTIIEAART